MIELNNWKNQAAEKLREGKKAVAGPKEKAMAPAVAAALQAFCQQDTEFAQAVAQGGSFAECMKAVARGVGNSISDLEAYKKAVQFYFPGAKIQMTMTIDLIGEADTQRLEPEKPVVMALSLDDFLR